MDYTVDQITENVAWSHQSALNHFTRTQQRVANATQPGQVTSADLERLIDDQAVVLEWMDIVATITQDGVDVKDAIRLQIVRLQNRIMNWSPSSSTSDVYRVADKARMAAAQRVYKEIQHWV